MEFEPFAITQYIWPLKEVIQLCPQLDYRLMNPEPEVVPIIAENLRVAYFSDRSEKDDNEENFYENAIRSVFNTKGDRLEELGFKALDKDFWTFLAANFVIIKTENWLEARDEFDDSHTFDVMNSYISILDFHRGMFIDFVTNSLLVKQFLPTLDTSLGGFQLNFSITSLLLSLINYTDDRKDEEGKEWHISDGALNSLLDSAKIINACKLMSEPCREMLFVGELIYDSFAKRRNYYAKTIAMCSLIEYMVARSPDYTRFNIDESINKQFQMKPSILINKYDPNSDIQKTADFLKIAYDLRSSIAHGSFDRVDKILSKYGNTILEFDAELHLVTLQCFRAYLALPDFANFLKKY